MNTERPNEPITAKPREFADGMAWYDTACLPVEGQGWADVEYPFDRLPKRARDILPKEVWAYSKHASGLCVRFRTESSHVSVRWRLRYHVRISHMSPTGLSGVDLYALGESGWGWVGTGYPTNETWCEAVLAERTPEGFHEYLLYLPLCAGIRDLRIGIQDGTTLMRGAAYAPERARPLCFYGTSLTQGASASRAGMSYTALLGRWFQMPVVNLGFSGAGKMDLPMADLLAELDVGLYIVDCTANISPEIIRERAVPFVERLRSQRPTTPLLLSDCPPYQNGWFLKKMHDQYTEKNAAMRAAFAQLEAKGCGNIYYLHAIEYGMDDTEAGVANHATDLGFVRIAEAYRKHISGILGFSATASKIRV